MTDPQLPHPLPQPPHLNVGGRVLAALDASTAYGESVGHYAAWAARRLDAPLEYLHVLDRQPETAATADLSGSLELGARTKLLQDLTALDEARSRLAREQGRLLLQQTKAIAGAHGMTAETRLRHGGLVDTLIELEADVRLFVLGKRGEHADFAKGHLGSQLERVVRAVHRPLLVASRAYAEIRRVLIAFDGSPTTRKGVEMVAASPLFRDLDIRVVMVGTETETHLAALRWALDTLTAAGLAAEGSVLPGDPEDTIGHYARDEHADLLVMGAYGHSRIRQLIVGSTTTTLLRTCRIPVLLLR
jgi:nucleotide-binding universal stress UspA family protein